MSINYDHIKAGTAVINEFDKKLRALCKEYQQKLSDACPEDISRSIEGVHSDAYYCILLPMYDTLGDALKDGFGNACETVNDLLHLSQEVDGIKIVTAVCKKGDETK